MTDDLRERYNGVEHALADVTMMAHPTARIHRAGDGGEPWCGSKSDVEPVDTATALNFGAALCRNCYHAALEQLARRDGSGVTHVGDPPETPDDPAVEFDGVRDQRGKLDALTADVLVATGGANTFHAPASDHTAVCGEPVDGTRRRVDQAPPSARPCRRCFTDVVVDRFDARDATPAIVDAAADGGRLGE